MSELIETPERRWGEGAINLKEKNLPALKATRALKPLLTLPGGALILDFGCGEGKLLSTVFNQRQDLKLFGVDIQKPLKAPLPFEFQMIGEDGDASLFNKKFDCILSLDVLEHVPDLEKTLIHLKRHLNQNGKLVIFVPMEGEPLSPFGFYRWLLGSDLYMRTKSHAHAYRRAEFLPLFEKHFEIEEMTYSYHFIGTLLDSTFFAFCSLKGLASWFWKKNSIYRPENKGKGLMNKVLELANWICFYESKWLAKRSWPSMGLHITARPRH